MSEYDPEDASEFMKWWLSQYEDAETDLDNGDTARAHVRATMSVAAALAALNVNLQLLKESYNGWKDIGQ